MHGLNPIKFVIYRGEILLGRVEFHRELLPTGFDPKDVKGGGLASLDKDERIIEVQGKSEDFGYYDNELIHSAKWPKQLAGYTIREIKGPYEV
jgi:hypothetical protein